VQTLRVERPAGSLAAETNQNDDRLTRIDELLRLDTQLVPVLFGQRGGVQVIGGSETPGITTFTPRLIMRPPMNVAPIFTLIGPTFGGTNVSSGDAAAGVVSARAPTTGAARPNRLTTAAAADNFRASIRYLLW
jgi:hypothetical protein